MKFSRCFHVSEVGCNTVYTVFTCSIYLSFLSLSRTVKFLYFISNRLPFFLSRERPFLRFSISSGWVSTLFLSLSRRTWLRSHLWHPLSLFRGCSPRVTATLTVTNDPGGFQGVAMDLSHVRPGLIWPHSFHRSSSTDVRIRSPATRT